MVLCLTLVVNAHVEIIIPRRAGRGRPSPTASGQRRHTSEVEVTCQKNSRGPAALCTLYTWRTRLAPRPWMQRFNGKLSCLKFETHQKRWSPIVCLVFRDGWLTRLSSMKRLQKVIMITIYLYSTFHKRIAAQGKVNRQFSMTSKLKSKELVSSCTTVTKRPARRPDRTDW